jgi:hypothetical protein
MSQKITTSTFNINVPSTNLVAGEELIFKLHLDSITAGLSGNFTASLGEGNLKVSSLATTTGYNQTTATSIDGFFDSASMATGSNTNEIVLSSGVSSFYGGSYIFAPNPLTGSISSLYDVPVGYGDVDYPFSSSLYDIVLVYLSDGTYIESRIINSYLLNSKLHLTLDTDLTPILKNNLANQTYTRFLLLSKQSDETNAILTFTKRAGKTSYGFLISNDISSTVLDNIDTITKEVKQKLLSDQSVINDISGGNF